MVHSDADNQLIKRLFNVQNRKRTRLTQRYTGYIAPTSQQHFKLSHKPSSWIHKAN